MTKFETGKTYSTRSICDYDCIINVTVAKRTAKTITTTEGKVLRIIPGPNGLEQVRPWGRYSMAPIVDSTDRDLRKPLKLSGGMVDCSPKSEGGSLVHPFSSPFGAV